MKRRIHQLLSVILLSLLLLSLFVPVAFAEEETLTNLYTDAVRNQNTRGILSADGSSDTAPYVFTSGAIAVEAGDVITFGPTPIGLPHVLQGYAADGSVADANVGAARLTAAERGFNEHEIYSYTVPQNVCSVRLVLPGDMTRIFTVTKNRPFDAFDYDAYWQDPSRVKFVQKLGRIFERKPDSPLWGRSALFVGDSICYAFDNDFYYNAGWEGRLQDINGMDSLNLASPGASVSTFWADNRVVAQFDLTERTDFEFVVMHGVANDAAQNVPVGTLSDGFDAELDEDTFAGGLEALFREAKRRYPDATLGFIINYPLPLFTTGAYPDIDDYVDVMTAACEKWGVHALDLYHDDEFCNNVLKVNTKQYLFDAVHPNAVGYDLLYPKIEAYMEELLAIRYPAPPEEPEDPATDDTTAPPTDTAAPAKTGCGAAITALPCLSVALVGTLLIGRRSKKKSDI